MQTKTYEPLTRASESQVLARRRLHSLFAEHPLPEDDLLVNLGLFARSSAFAKFLFLDEIYRPIVPLPGVIMVFGTWWGQDVVVLHNLRAVHEPYNYLRRVIGFDTFEGYPVPGGHDRSSETIKPGAYHTAPGYEHYLDALLQYHNQEHPLPHLPKHELVKGDVCVTLARYLENHPETIVALAYLDLALYEPTRRVLELLRPVMAPGGSLVLDELNAPAFPGETVAFREVFGQAGYELKRSQVLPDRTIARLLVR